MDLSLERCLKSVLDLTILQNGRCFSILLSKALGFAIIVTSIIALLPQIIRIWKNQSAQSINVITVLTAVYIVTIRLCYCYVQSFPISSYGELIVVGLQLVVLATLVIKYNVSSTASNFFIGVFPVIVYLLTSEAVPFYILWYLQALGVPVFLSGRILQSYTIYKEKTTGQLSGFSCVMQFVLAAPRIFTLLFETGDPMIVFSQILTTLCAGLILAQFVYYSSKNKN